MAAVTICSDFGAQKNKVSTVSTVSPSIFQEQLYVNKMDNLEDMDRFLEKFNLQD